jgi:serpin B
VEDVLQSGEYWELTQNDWKWERQKKLKVNLSLPKFDISTQADLIDGMKNLGITDVFSPDTSDFSAITEMSRLFVGKIDHAVRVAIDEEGVIAASYTVIGLSYGEIPTIPDDEIDFTLDRPFLFLVTSQHNLPLFTGVVEQP